MEVKIKKIKKMEEFKKIIEKILVLRKKYDANMKILWDVEEEEGNKNPLLFLIYRREFLEGLKEIYSDAIKVCLKKRKNFEDDKTISIILKDLKKYTEELNNIKEHLKRIKGE